MTGNTKVWRAPLAGLASFAMIATMGLAAGTAAAASSTFTAAPQAAYTVVLNSGNSATFNKDKAEALDTTLGAGSDDASVSSDKKTVTIKNVPVKIGQTETMVTTVEDAANAALDLNAGYKTPGDNWFDGAAFGTTNKVQPTLTLDKVASNGQVTLYAHVLSSEGEVTVDFKGYAGDDPKVPSGDKLADWQIPDTSNGQHVKAWMNGDKTLDKATKYTEDVSYTPTWYDQQDPIITYKTVNGTTVTVIGTSQNVAPGQKFDLKSASDLGLTGKAVSYFSDKEFKTAFTANTTGVTKDTDVYVQGTTQKTINYSYKVATLKTDGSGDYDVKVNAYGSDTIATNLNFQEPPTPSTRADGAEFKGWYTSQADADKLTASAKVSFPYADTQVTTLYAGYGEATAKKDIKVSFDLNYNGSPAATVVTYKQDATVSKPADPKRDGYVFKGWYTDAATTAGNEVFKSNAEVKATANVTYYAKWQNATDAAVEKVATLRENPDDKVYTKDSYEAYKKVYDKYFDGTTVKLDVDKAEAAKAVQAAVDKLVEKTNNKLHRLYNTNNGDHYFTSADSEAAMLTALGLNYEGTPYKVVSLYKANGDEWTGGDVSEIANLGAVVYSVYNPNTGEHLLVGQYEAEQLAKAGWNNEGAKFAAPQASSTKDVYRVYNPNTTGPAHVYVSKSEATGLVAQGWRWDFGGKVAYKLG